jgi:hypothetical protein
VSLLVPYKRPRGAIHDLAHWLELSEGAFTVLVLSERTLYLLQNLADLDLTFSSRYASSRGEDGYYTPTPGTDDWETYVQAYELAQKELSPMGLEVYGYAGTGSAYVYQVAEGNGDITLVGLTVPDGELWEIQAASMYRDAVTGSPVSLQINKTEIITYLTYGAPGATGLQLWGGKVVLGSGEKLQATFSDSTYGETVVLSIRYAVLNPPV